MPRNTKPSREGVAALFLPPFTLHSDAVGAAPVKVQRGRRLFRVYWPHVDSGRAGPLLRQVQLENIPFMDGVPPFSGTLPTMETQGIDRDWGCPAIFADALRIDCYPASAFDSADELGRQFYSLVRFHTRQWWVGRDRRFEEPLCRNALSIDSRGGLPTSGYIEGVAKSIGLIGYERLLTPDLFKCACVDLSEHREVPFFWDLLLDAHYFHALGDTRMTVLHLAMACENAIRALVGLGENSGLPVHVEHRHSSSLEKNLRNLRGSEGTSFETERPGSFGTLVQTWRARHGPAHGSGVQVRLPEDPGDPTPGASRALMIRAALSLFAWLGVEDVPQSALSAEDQEG